MDRRPRLKQFLAMRARRLEDRIRELCARAVAAKDAELGTIFFALQDSLHEHNNRLRKLAAAKLAAWRPRGDGKTILPPVSGALFECAICRKAIPLEVSKVSEEGQPVHEECYVAKLITRIPLPQPR
jgi:hypothetical protein